MLPILVEVEDLARKGVRMQQAESFSAEDLILRTSRPLPLGTLVHLRFLFPSDPALVNVVLPNGCKGVSLHAEVADHGEIMYGRVAVRFAFDRSDEDYALFAEIVKRASRRPSGRAQELPA